MKSVKIVSCWLARLIGIVLVVSTPLVAEEQEDESLSLQGESHWSDSFQVHGFATQGAAWTSDNHLFGNSPDGTFDFRELGLNASLRPTRDILLSGQLLSRTAGEVDDGSLRLDYGFADLTFHQSLSSKWGVRVGRVKNPLGFYNETRDVEHTRPSILLPQSIYLDRARALLLSTDAVYLYAEESLGPGTLFLDLGYGYPQADDEELERSLLWGRDWKGHLDGQPSLLGRLMYETEDGWGMAATYAEAKLDFEADAIDFPMTDGGLDLTYNLLSLQYEQPKWSLTLEYLRQEKRTQGLGLIPDGYVESDNYYLQGTYRPRDDLELLLRYEVGYNNNNDKDGSKSAAASAAAAPLLNPMGVPTFVDHNFYGTDWTLGVRWDVTPEWVLKAEYHKVHGTIWLPFTENRVPNDMAEDWDLLMFSASYRF
jgi:hypothetical protein